MRTSRVVFLMAASVFLAAAQSDPPGRIGRLSYMSGDVSFRPADVDDWMTADMNRPLTTGDHLWTDYRSRAELHIGTAALRLASRTAFEFLNLDDGNVQIRLTEGSLIVRLRNLADQETFEVDTPNLAFSLLRAGEYRIDVNPDRQTTTVTVRAGQGEVTGDGQSFTVHPREQAEVSSGGDALSYSILPAPPLDDWDNWCYVRDRREDQSQSAQYVSREMVGYQDLDDNGSWESSADYGSVWVPRTVAVGWAPYRYGHWIWIDPWGWTWVDDAPWGFAPFHYGRWVYVGHWAWVPGPIAVRPVYAPALVAWVGGPRFGLSVSIGGGGGGGGIGWFPLAPREVYRPAYRASNAYITRVNVTNTTIVNNVNVYNNTNVNYINRSVPGAVTAVPQNTFGNSRRVQDAAVPVQPRDLQSALVINTAPVAPTRQSVLGNGNSDNGRRVAQPPAETQNRAVVAKIPPPPPPVPFAQRQQALTANPGRPLDSSEVQQLRSTQPVPARSYIRSAQTPGNSGAGRPASQPTPGTPAGQYQRPQPDYRPGGREGTPPQPNNTFPPPQQNNPPPRVQPDIQRRPQEQQPNTVPPPRIQRDIPPPQQPQNTAPPPRLQRDVPPPQQQAPPPRLVERPVEQPRPPEREVRQPPPQQQAPPPRLVERPVEQPRPEREVRQPPPERPAQKEPPKEEKKDDKKDEKKK